MDNSELKHIREEVLRTAKVVREGGVILYPTDTIWGLGCDPKNEKALKKLIRIKRRIEAKSLIILVCENESIEKFVEKPHLIAYDLIEKWNKPLTIVFPRAKDLSKLIVGDDNSVGIRVTKEFFSHSLLKELKHPIISTSANLSGEPSPISFRTVNQSIKDSVDYIVDYKRDTITDMKSSTIIRISDNGSFEVIRP